MVLRIMNLVFSIYGLMINTAHTNARKSRWNVVYRRLLSEGNLDQYPMGLTVLSLFFVNKRNQFVRHKLWCRRTGARDSKTRKSQSAALVRRCAPKALEEREFVGSSRPT